MLVSGNFYMKFTENTGSFANSIELWDIQSGSRVRTFDGHGTGSVTVSPDGHRIAFEGAGIEVRDLQSGAQLLSLQGASGDVSSLAFSPDGRTLVAGGERLARWSVPSGEMLPPLESPSAQSLAGIGASVEYASVAFSPDGRTLASGAFKDDGDAAAARWDTASGRELPLLRGCVHVAFAPDGRTLACGSRSAEEIKLFDTATGEEIRSLAVRDGSGGLAFSPDGHLLATGTTDGSVVLLDLRAIDALYGRDPDELLAESSRRTGLQFNGIALQLQPNVADE
jgi:WD40 repeat protein